MAVKAPETSKYQDSPPAVASQVAHGHPGTPKSGVAPDDREPGLHQQVLGQCQRGLALPAGTYREPLLGHRRGFAPGADRPPWHRRRRAVGPLLFGLGDPVPGQGDVGGSRS